MIYQGSEEQVRQCIRSDDNCCDIVRKVTGIVYNKYSWICNGEGSLQLCGTGYS